MYCPNCRAVTSTSVAARGCSRFHGTVLAAITNAARRPARKMKFRRSLEMGNTAISQATIPPEITFSEFRNGDYNMPVTSRVSSVSVRPFEIRVATPQDLDQLCGLASELLVNIHAEGTA